MRKITIFAFITICLASMASGMGQAGAVEPTPTVEVTTTPIVTQNVDRRIIINIDKGVRASISFVDQNGDVFKTIGEPGVSIRISHNSQYAMLVHWNSEKTTPEYFYKTGEPDILHHKIELYNVMGEKVSEKDDFGYEPVRVMDSGHFIAHHLSLDLSMNEDPISDEVANNPPKDKLVFYDKQGQKIYEVQGKSIDKDRCSISPDGSWILYLDLKADDYIVKNIKTSKQYIFPYKQFKGSLDVDDSGQTLIYETHNYGAKGIMWIRKVYNHDTGIVSEISRGWEK